MMKLIVCFLFCISLFGCTTPTPKKVNGTQAAPRALAGLTPVQSFFEKSYNNCRYENGYFFVDDFGNSICSRNYRSADRSNRDVILIFNFLTGTDTGESRRTNGCTTLSSDQGEKSYLCEAGKRYFYIAHYQRGYNSGNRIWVEEVPAKKLNSVLNMNHEDYRVNLKKQTGLFELKPDEFLKSRDFLNLIK